MKSLTKIILSGIALIVLSTMSGCTSMQNMIVENSIEGTKGSQDPQKVAQFEKKFNQVLDDIDKKDDYKRVPLDGEADLTWFIQQSFKLSDNQISKKEYTAAGEKKFPGYTKTFNYLADEFTKK